MVEELAILLKVFPGEANRTRCFAHILNLVAKSVIRQFDVPKAKRDEALNDAAHALAQLANDLDTEELLSQEVDEEEDIDDTDGLVDERAAMSDDEREEFDETVQPVRLMLVKVCSNFFSQFKYINWQATCLASQNVVCYQELNYSHIASMVRHSPRLEDARAHDAA